MIVVEKTLDVFTDRFSIVQVHSCVLLDIVVDKSHNSKPLNVLKLEESENKTIYTAISRDLKLTVAWIIHVDRTDGWGDNLHDVTIWDFVADGAHNLYMVNMGTDSQDAPILVWLKQLEKLICIGQIPKNF